MFLLQRRDGLVRKTAVYKRTKMWYHNHGDQDDINKSF